METANTEILHVVIAVIEEFVEYLNWLFDEILIGIDVANCFDGLLEDSFAEMERCVMERLLEDKLVQYLIYF